MFEKGEKEGPYPPLKQPKTEKMKATKFMNGLKAIVAFIVLSATFVACGPKHDEESVPAPQVTIKDATNVTTTAATLVASFTPFSDKATVAFEITEVGTTLNWQPQPVAINLVGQNVKTTITVTLNMSGLKQGASYKVRVKASNAAGQVTSDETSFYTIAGYDVDGNAFHQVLIGKQIWMVEALKVTKFRNGDPIPTSTDPAIWWNATTPLFCWYNNDISNKEYGALYNWYVAFDPRKVAPQGWHVPSYEEIQKLVTFLGGGFVAGPALMEKGSAHWGTTTLTATNSSGFTAIPGGFYGVITTGSTQMIFAQKGVHVYYWTNTSIMGVAGAALNIAATTTADPNSGYNTHFGLSIKCIKDAI